MKQEMIDKLKIVIDRAVPHMLEVEVRRNIDGTKGIIRVYTNIEGTPLVETLLMRAPFNLMALLNEVERLQEAMRTTMTLALPQGQEPEEVNDRLVARGLALTRVAQTLAAALDWEPTNKIIPATMQDIPREGAGA